ncbi:MAG: hypothetical protein MSS83_05385 [Methanobrevibacter sp.]|uniref:hypothetical protein n=1 Tax=Methanobrevibacter sp. TaxID=66852 RepID=UPI0031F4ACC6|nr:hypothetical protein [Methanobrevibacter sp.]
MSLELTIIIAVVGLLVSVLSIISFVSSNKQQSKKDGTMGGEMINDIRYIKNTQQDIIVSQKEISNKLDNNNERVTRLEEQVKVHESRLDKLEK